jgi:wyosine [tRNA(Phe)-imidazoG37] synthetase (radical SAM superfamily)
LDKRFARGVRIGLLTNGILLGKRAARIGELIDQLILSLDAATPELYARIRSVETLPIILKA